MMEIINVSEKDLQNEAMFQKMGPVDTLELLNQLIQERNEKAQREQEMLCELNDKSHQKKWTSFFENPPEEAALKAFLANPKEGLLLKGSRLITNRRLTELFTQAPNTGMRTRFLALPESPLLTYKEIRILTVECPNLEYMNVSGCGNLTEIITAEGEWSNLKTLDLSHNHLFFDESNVLQKGNWPLLEYLNLNHTKMPFLADVCIYESS